MAHYATIDENNIVTQVIVGKDEDDLPEDIASWEEYFTAKGDGIVLRTSYNTYGGVHYTDGEPSEDQSKALRFNYAGIGFTFDPDKGTDGAFIPPKPFESWVLNEDTCLWEAPVAYPEDGGVYTWDEETTNWILIPEPS
jgi:hypothetical protein